MEYGHLKRVHVVISGLVQGVFFRQYTRKHAIQYNLTGWVKNRPDGDVEAVFEGDELDVELMIDWCRNGPPSARISRVDITREEPTDTFPDFRIIYE
jgi:acylphosphatase